MAERHKLEDDRRDVLVENTAQAVHKHLDKLFQEEPRFRSRWVWGLPRTPVTRPRPAGSGCGSRTNGSGSFFAITGYPLPARESHT